MKTLLVAGAIDCASKDGFDVQKSFRLMASLRGRGGAADFDRCVELARAHQAVKKGEWGKYLCHPSVDISRSNDRNMRGIAAMPDGKELCSTYGFTMTLQLARVKDADQRATFIAEYPPPKHTVAGIKALIDQVFGQTQDAKPTVPRPAYNTVVLAAGRLYLNPDELDVRRVQEQYDLLYDAFRQSPERQALIPALTQARDILVAILRPAGILSEAA